MSQRKMKRKRPYRAHEFGQALAAELATLGDGGHMKVLMPDGLSMHRVVGLVPTLEDDVIVQLEAAPCWRKRGVAGPSVESTWKSIGYITNKHDYVLVTEGSSVTVARESYPEGWFDYVGNKLSFMPTHFAELPSLPGAKQ